MRRTLLVLAVAAFAGCGVKAPPRPPTSVSPASSGTAPGDAPGTTPSAPKDPAPIPPSNASPGSNPR
jgi:hypothetical protein